MINETLRQMDESRLRLQKVASAANQLVRFIDAMEGAELPFNIAQGLAVAADVVRVSLGEEAKIKSIEMTDVTIPGQVIDELV